MLKFHAGDRDETQSTDRRYYGSESMTVDRISLRQIARNEFARR
jgi:hypothetical protein